jgi:hypothetical protein
MARPLLVLRLVGLVAMAGQGLGMEQQQLLGPLPAGLVVLLLWRLIRVRWRQGCLTWNFQQQQLQQLHHSQR